MGMTRRQFGMIASAVLLAGRRAASATPGLRAHQPHPRAEQPGPAPRERARSPAPGERRRYSFDAGLAGALAAVETMRLERPTYHFDAEPGTRLRNGHTLRAFSLELADKVRGALAAKRFPVVIGGDCSVLLGGLYGARLAGGRGLVHVDGHSDFTQEKSYATPQTLGAAAGMDLALATGRGEKVLTDWPDVGVLAADADTVQVGERGEDEEWFPESYGDILKTEITRLTVQKVQAEGVEASARRVIARLEERGLDRAWLHVDLDVLDEAVMPAVDSPGKPGFSYDELSALCRRTHRERPHRGRRLRDLRPRARSGAQICRPAGRLHRRRHPAAGREGGRCVTGYLGNQLDPGVQSDSVVLNGGRGTGSQELSRLSTAPLRTSRS